MNEGSVSVDIIIPCYNPLPKWEEEIIANYTELNNLLQSCDLSFILINDGSTNDHISEREVALLSKHIPHFKYISYDTNQGKGFALRKGVEQSSGKYIIFTDVDFPYTSESILHIYQKLKAGDNVAVGFRTNNYYEKVPAIRKFISKVLRFFLSSILRLPVADTQCGLKGFDEKGKAVFLTTKINRFLFDLEFVMLAGKEKSITLSPVQVELKQGVVFSKMRLNILVTESFNFVYLFIKRMMNV